MTTRRKTKPPDEPGGLEQRLGDPSAPKNTTPVKSQQEPTEPASHADLLDSYLQVPREIICKAGPRAALVWGVVYFKGLNRVGCYASLDTISEYLGGKGGRSHFGRWAVRAALQALVEGGWVEMQERGSSGKTNLYRAVRYQGDTADRGVGLHLPPHLSAHTPPSVLTDTTNNLPKNTNNEREGVPESPKVEVTDPRMQAALEVAYRNKARDPEAYARGVLANEAKRRTKGPAAPDWQTKPCMQCFLHHPPGGCEEEVGDEPQDQQGA